MGPYCIFIFFSCNEGNHQAALHIRIFIFLQRRESPGRSAYSYSYSSNERNQQAVLHIRIFIFLQLRRVRRNLIKVSPPAQNNVSHICYNIIITSAYLVFILGIPRNCKLFCCTGCMILYIDSDPVMTPWLWDK